MGVGLRNCFEDRKKSSGDMGHVKAWCRLNLRLLSTSSPINTTIELNYPDKFECPSAVGPAGPVTNPLK